MHCEQGTSVLTPPGEEWPLLFNHAYNVRGSAFDAVVILDGALLATITDGHRWLDGVYPYEVSEGDETLSKAYENLKVFMAGILADLAEESTDFGDFEKKVQFFATHPGDERALEAWKNAVQKVRAGAANVPDIKARDSEGWTPSVIAVEVPAADHIEAISVPAVVPDAPLQGDLAA